MSQSHGRFRTVRSLLAAAFAAATMVLAVHPAQAQFMDCPPTQQPLIKIPEFVSQNGVLRGTVLLTDQQELLAYRQPPQSTPGAANTSIKCSGGQYVRTFIGVGAQPAPPATPAGQYPSPLPGPTLRARVGDVINLTFLNQINPNDFGDSIDRAENGKGNGCDSSSTGYPGPAATGDTFPDCFHGSSTGNIHFHGTHTNPNTTGDNVFIEVRPSPRVNGKPVITADTYAKQFAAFYEKCNSLLRRDQLLEWPKTWNDTPLGPLGAKGTYVNSQMAALQQYDKNRPKPQQLWPVDKAQYDAGQWPQYYIGAYPYCFRLPIYASPDWPPRAAAMHDHMTMGPLSLDNTGPLQMGQSPGTHWYHAHKHGSTTINVSNGMSGVFIIEGRYDDDLNGFYGAGWTRTQPVMLINQIGVTPNLERPKAGRTDKGENFSLNGRIDPVVTMKPGEVQMWRIANSSTRAGAYFGAPEGGVHWRRIAQDGVQFANENYVKSEDKPFLMTAGNRTDMLIKAPTAPGKYDIKVRNEVDPSDLAATNNYAVTLVTINVAGDVATGNQAQFIPQAPTPPSFLADITPKEVTGTKVVTFASTPPGNVAAGVYAQHTINGVKFSGEVGESVLLNKVEEWTIQNATYGPLISHPFHIHINPFQVVEVFAPNEVIGDPTDPSKQKPKYVLYGTTQPPNVDPDQCAINVKDPSTWKPCGPPAKGPFIWWDVFPIPSGISSAALAGNNPPQAVKDDQGNPVTFEMPGHFKMRSRFVDYPGQFVIHCHILAHEDRGMMMVVEVTPNKMLMSHQ